MNNPSGGGGRQDAVRSVTTFPASAGGPTAGRSGPTVERTTRSLTRADGRPVRKAVAGCRRGGRTGRGRPGGRGSALARKRTAGCNGSRPRNPETIDEAACEPMGIAVAHAIRSAPALGELAAAASPRGTPRDTPASGARRRPGYGPRGRAGGRRPRRVRCAGSSRPPGPPRRRPRPRGPRSPALLDPYAPLAQDAKDVIAGARRETRTDPSLRVQAHAPPGLGPGECGEFDPGQPAADDRDRAGAVLEPSTSGTPGSTPFSTPAMAGPGSTTTRAPRSRSSRVAIAVPAPTSTTREPARGVPVSPRPRRAGVGGQPGRAASYWAATDSNGRRCPRVSGPGRRTACVMRPVMARPGHLRFGFFRAAGFPVRAPRRFSYRATAASYSPRRSFSPGASVRERKE